MSFSRMPNQIASPQAASPVGQPGAPQQMMGMPHGVAPLGQGGMMSVGGQMPPNTQLGPSQLPSQIPSTSQIPNASQLQGAQQLPGAQHLGGQIPTGNPMSSIPQLGGQLSSAQLSGSQIGAQLGAQLAMAPGAPSQSRSSVVGVPGAAGLASGAPGSTGTVPGTVPGSVGGGVPGSGEVQTVPYGQSQPMSSTQPVQPSTGATQPFASNSSVAAAAAAPGTPAQASPKLLELLDQIKSEFSAISGEASRALLQKDEADSKLIHQHMNELTQVRKTVYELDKAHRQIRDKYEAELAKLRQKLDAIQPRNHPLISRLEEGGEANPQPSLQPLPLPSDGKEKTKYPPGHFDIPNSGLDLSQTVANQSNSGQNGEFSGLAALADSAEQETRGEPRSGAQQAVHSSPHETQHPSQSLQPSQAPPIDSQPSAAAPVAPLVLPQNTSAGGTASANSDAHLVNLDIDQVPNDFKRVTPDYKVVYNPKFPPSLDVSLVRSLQHASVVCCVRFSEDGRLLATGCNRSAQIYDVATGELLYRLQDPNVDGTVDLYIRSVCFSPDGKFLATGAEDHKVRVWHISTRDIRNMFEGHDQDIYSLVFSSDGKFVVSGSGDRHVKMWDVETGRCYREFVIDDGVTAVALSPDNRYVAAGSLDKSVRVWDVHENELVERLDGPGGHEDSVYSVSYRHGRREIVSGSLDKTLKVWELSPPGEKMKGRVKNTIRGHNDYVLSVAATPDSKWILSGSKDRTVQMWDANTGEVQLVLRAHVNSVISIAPSPEGTLFASGGGDFTAKIWRYVET